MRKSLLISTVSAIVLMNASHAFADTTVTTWEALKDAVENTGGTIVLGDDIKNVPNGGAITSYKPGTVIDGNSHTISASESTEDGNFRFISNSTAADIPLEIKNITFNGGHIISSSSSAQGGAIYNSGSNAKIGNIHGDFEGNYAKSTNSRAQGGAIYNSGTIGNITGSFIDNYVKGSTGSGDFSAVGGGAIFNNNGGTIGNITGDFKNNHATASGGAIYNYGSINATKIGNITGDFIGNYAHFIGGAISNVSPHRGQPAEIGNIKGDFKENRVIGDWVYGGAVYNSGNILSVLGDFSDNYVEGETYAYGGAIYQVSSPKVNSQQSFTNSQIGQISGKFTNNHVTASAGDASGGAIYNIAYLDDYEALIPEISKSSFTGNAAGNAGGAIWNKGTIDKIIETDFANNVASYGAAVWNERKLNSLTDVDFTNNQALSSEYSYGGALVNYTGGSIQTISDVNFTGNQTILNGGALHNLGEITTISKGNFENNKAAYGGAISNNNHIGRIENSNFNNNIATHETYDSFGGALYLWNPIDEIVNTSFTNNHAGTAGGAIYSFADVNILADNAKIKFSGNTANNWSNAIYLKEKTEGENVTLPTLTLKAMTNGTIDFEDEIDGVEGYKIEINGTDQSRSVDQTGKVIFNNNIRNAAITLADSTVTLGNVSYLNNNNSLTINSGKFNVASLGVNDVLTANSITVNGGELNITNADVDFTAEKMGSFENITFNNDTKINVQGFSILNPGTEEKEQINIAFAEEDYKSAVSFGVDQVIAPVYKYGVSYDPETGEFIFTRGDLANPEPEEPEVDWFNQGVFASDVFMMLSLNMQNSAVKEVASMDPNKEPCMGRVWAMPFYSDDTIEYKNFYDVDSRNYGLIAGVDTRVFGNSDLSHVYTLFGAYSEGKDKYEGIKVENKSWLLGLKASMFSDNGLYGDAIVDIASHDMDADTFYGSDSHDTYGYGAALKGGYRHDIEKVNIDTSVMLSWQQIKGDDFTAKSGAKMKTDDYSRLSLMPQVKVGYDLNKVRPYALVRYNFVLDEEGSSVANDTTLPEIESKDYVEYGLGVETTTNSNHSGFAHVLRHDGGREGWAITAGYRYNF